MKYEICEVHKRSEIPISIKIWVMILSLELHFSIILPFIKYSIKFWG